MTVSALIRQFGLLLCLIGASVSPAQIQAQTPDLETLLIERADALAGGKSADLKNIVLEIAASGDASAAQVLTYWLDGELFFRRDNNQIVRAVKSDAGFQLSDAVTGETLDEVDSRAAKKVKNSTPIKRAIRPALAGLRLTSPDTAVRLVAAEELAKKPDADGLQALRTARGREQNPEVAAAFDRAIVLSQLAFADDSERLAVLNAMGTPLDVESRAALQRIADNERLAPDLTAAATEKLEQIENQVRIYSFGNDILFGLSRASVLLLSAIGLAITFGVMRVINMAHGEFIMMGAYTTFVIQSFTGLSAGFGFVISLPLAFVVGFSFGVLLERLVIRFLYGRPLETLLATFGVSLFLQQLFRLIFNPQNKPVVTPEWLTGSINFNPILGITTPRVFVFFFALMVFAALVIFLQRSRFGLEMRAVTQNRTIARTVGINSGRVDYLTFGLGSGIAGLAGAVLSQVLKVNPEMGAELIIPSFMVVVVGGVGNLWGTLVGAGLVGLSTKLVEPWFPNNTLLATALIFGGVILFIQFRPKGIFAQKGRSAEL